MQTFSYRERVAGLCLCALMLTGCLPLPDGGEDSGASLPELILGGNAPRPPAADRHVEAEPNDSYEQAEPVTIAESLELTGTLAAGDLRDLDLFDLGPAQPGDELTAELSIAANSDIILGVIDDHQRVIGYIDPANFTTGPKTLDIVIREPTQVLLVAVTTRSTSGVDRPYTANLRMYRNIGIPDYRPQVVVLDFDGAQGVSISRRPAVNIPPFDAARIDGRYAGQTDTIINNIYQMVLEDYAGLGVAIYLSSDPNIPEGPRSTVYFGTYDSRLLGLADNIDPYNASLEQAAILYTDTFSVFMPLSPDVTAISQALANTTSHEIGHLLGLRHTSDTRDIMDTTASARQMMMDQWFRVSPLNPSVIQLGYQDSPGMLAWTLGGVAPGGPNAKTLAARQKAIDLASGGFDFYIPRDQLMSCGCDTCHLDE